MDSEPHIALTLVSQAQKHFFRTKLRLRGSHRLEDIGSSCPGEPVPSHFADGFPSLPWMFPINMQQFLLGVFSCQLRVAFMTAQSRLNVALMSH